MLLSILPINNGNATEEQRYTVIAQFSQAHETITQQIQQHQDRIHTLTPLWFEAQANGTVQRRAAIQQQELYNVQALALQTTSALVPIITNSGKGNVVTELVKDEAAIQNHTTQISNLVNQQQFDGITIDYEAFSSSSRDNFSAFIEHLSQELHTNNKLLSVMVHPKESDRGIWDAETAQDWRRIGNAADTVVIMTYHYSWERSAPGPQAPQHWLNNVLNFGKTQIPEEKMIVGIPLFGYQWNNHEGKRISSTQAEQERGDATKERDTESQEPFFEKDGITTFYQDSESIAAKMQTIITNHGGVKGISITDLGEGNTEHLEAIMGNLPPIQTEQQSPPANIDELDATVEINNNDYQYKERTADTTQAVPGDTLTATLTITNTTKEPQHDIQATLHLPWELSLKNEQERTCAASTLEKNQKLTCKAVVTLNNVEIDQKNIPIAWNIQSKEHQSVYSSKHATIISSIPRATITIDPQQFSHIESNTEYGVTLIFTNTGSTSIFEPHIQATLSGPATFTTSSLAAASLQATTQEFTLPKHYQDQKTSWEIKFQTHPDIPENSNITISFNTTYRDLNNTSYTQTLQFPLIALKEGAVLGTQDQVGEESNQISEVDEGEEELKQSENKKNDTKDNKKKLNPWLYIIVPAGLLVAALLLVNIIHSIRDIRKHEEEDHEQRTQTQNEHESIVDQIIQENPQQTSKPEKSSKQHTNPDKSSEQIKQLKQETNAQEDTPPPPISEVESSQKPPKPPALK